MFKFLSLLLLISSISFAMIHYDGVIPEKRRHVSANVKCLNKITAVANIGENKSANIILGRPEVEKDGRANRILATKASTLLKTMPILESVQKYLSDNNLNVEKFTQPYPEIYIPDLKKLKESISFLDYENEAVSLQTLHQALLQIKKDRKLAKNDTTEQVVSNSSSAKSSKTTKTSKADNKTQKDVDKIEKKIEKLSTSEFVFSNPVNQYNATIKVILDIKDDYLIKELIHKLVIAISNSRYIGSWDYHTIVKSIGKVMSQLVNSGQFSEKDFESSVKLIQDTISDWPKQNFNANFKDLIRKVTSTQWPYRHHNEEAKAYQSILNEIDNILKEKLDRSGSAIVLLDRLKKVRGNDYFDYASQIINKLLFDSKFGPEEDLAISHKIGLELLRAKKLGLVIDAQYELLIKEFKGLLFQRVQNDSNYSKKDKLIAEYILDSSFPIEEIFYKEILEAVEKKLVAPAKGLLEQKFSMPSQNADAFINIELVFDELIEYQDGQFRQYFSNMVASFENIIHALDENKIAHIFQAFSEFYKRINGVVTQENRTFAMKQLVTFFESHKDQLPEIKYVDSRWPEQEVVRETSKEFLKKWNSSSPEDYLYQFEQAYDKASDWDEVQINRLQVSEKLRYFTGQDFTSLFKLTLSVTTKNENNAYDEGTMARFIISMLNQLRAKFEQSGISEIEYVELKNTIVPTAKDFDQRFLTMDDYSNQIYEIIDSLPNVTIKRGDKKEDSLIEEIRDTLGQSSKEQSVSKQGVSSGSTEAI